MNMDRTTARIPPGMVYRWPRPSLSCRLCRTKKLRCDRGQPCSNCAQRKVNCVYQDQEVAPPRSRPSKTILPEKESIPPGVSDPTETRASDISGLVDDLNGVQVQTHDGIPFGSAVSSEIRHLAEPNPTPPDAATLSECLPPLAQASELFAHFTRSLHPTLCVLHIPSTNALLHQIYQTRLQGHQPDLASLALMYSIFAGAALAWSTELLNALQVTREATKTAFTTYSRLALCILDGRQPCVPSSVTTLEAITTLSHVLAHSDGFSQELNQLRVRALLTARSMQVHRLDTAKRREERRQRGSNLIEDEVLRRIWWHIVSTDWLLSLTNGSNEGVYLLHPRHMNVDYPSNIDDERLSSLAGMQTDLSLSIPTSMSAFICRIQVAELCRQAVDALPPFSLDSSNDVGAENDVDYNLVLDLHARFQTFLDTLPAFLKLDPESIQQSAIVRHQRPYIAWQATLLHLGIHSRICRLHRPFHLLSFANANFAYSRVVCVRSAETVLHLRRTIDHVGALIQLKSSRFWLIVQHVFFAAIVLGTDMSQQPHGPNAAAQRDDVLAACRMLESSQHESPTLHKAITQNTKALRALLQNQSGYDLPTSSRSGRVDLDFMCRRGHSYSSDAVHFQSSGDIPTLSTDLLAMESSNAELFTQTSSSSTTRDNAQPTDDQAWEMLWSDMINAGLDLTLPEWSSLMELG